MEELIAYFPGLTARQREQLARIEGLYRDWNGKINIISRRDIDALYTHHVLHSLAIARAIEFAKGTRIVDVGTGGGFPGIPLAILFPYCHFTLVDSIGKKITVAQSVAGSLGLANVEVLQAQAETLRGEFDFALARAVAPLPTLCQWTRGLVRVGGINTLANGLIALKGGDIREELAPFRKTLTVWKISSFFEEPYFEQKVVLHVPFY